MNSHFERVETPTLNALCAYFACGVGDLLEDVTDAQLAEAKQAANTN